MKIAYFSDNFYPELSGISDSIITTGIELSKRGHEIHFFAPSYSEKNYHSSGLSDQSEPHLGENIFIHRLPSIPFPAPTGAGRLAIPDIFRGFDVEKFDIVHSQSIFGCGLDALITSKISKTPFVGTNHTLIEAFVPKYTIVQNTMRSFETWYYNHTNFVTTPSEFLIEEMQKNGLIVKAKPLSNPIASEFFHAPASKEDLKKKLGLRKFSILYAGRISPEKNIMDLFNAFVIFAKENTEAELILAGNGILLPSLKQKTKELGLENKIRFTGLFQGENKKTLYEYFHASDVFVMPSTSETQSMGVIQAMASALPVIVANSGPLPTLVAEDRGLVCEPNNPASLAVTLKNISEDKTLQEKFSVNGKKYAEEYSVSKIADEWEKIYKETIEKYARA